MFPGTPCTFSAFYLKVYHKYYLDKNLRRSSFYCFMRFSYHKKKYRKPVILLNFSLILFLKEFWGLLHEIGLKKNVDEKWTCIISSVKHQNLGCSSFYSSCRGCAKIIILCNFWISFDPSGCNLYQVLTRALGIVIE